MFSKLIVILPLMLSYLFTDRNWNRSWYNSLNKSSLDPPSWIFSIVWPILYLMMGYSLYLIINRRDNSALSFNRLFSLPIIIYCIMLFLNITWTNTFFTKQNVVAGFKQLFILIIFTLFTIFSFYKIDRYAAYLLIPYTLWLLFALYLNGYIVANN